MSYFKVFGELVAGNERILSPNDSEGVKTYAIINLVILGVIFGLSNYMGARYTNPELPVDGKFALITPLLFCGVGMFTMGAALIGYTLVYWAAAKAFGGQGTIGRCGELIGLTAIPFWFIAPLSNFFINYNHTSATRLLILIFIAMVTGWLFRLTKKSFLWGVGMSQGKASVAVVAMWIFSISSVYVFLP